MATLLTLNEALRTNRIDDFIAQAEAAGVAAAETVEFDSAIRRLVKAPPPEDQTSRSRGPGGSPGR